MVRLGVCMDGMSSPVTRRIAAVLACLCVIGLGAAPGAAQPARQPLAATEPEPLVQSPTRRARPRLYARPRIQVRPRYPYRSYHTLYPPPYDVEFPGPNATRQCTARYVEEARPSGTVVVPRMRCWWVQG